MVSNPQAAPDIVLRSSIFRFRRVWVIQEVWSARKDVYVYGPGDIAVDWQHVQLSSELLGRIWYHERRSNTAIASYSGFKDRWYALFSHPTMGVHPGYKPILLLVEMAIQGFSCSDQRDKIFGLLAMGHETHDLPHASQLITPNYKKPVRRVFMDFTKWHMMHSQCLKVLEAATWTLRLSPNLPRHGEEWPSWTLSPFKKPCTGLLRLSLVADFQASSTTSIDWGLFQQQRIIDPHLLLRGYSLGTVSPLGDSQLPKDESVHPDVQTMSPSFVEGHGRCKTTMDNIWLTFRSIPAKLLKYCTAIEKEGCVCSGQQTLNSILLALTCGGWTDHAHHHPDGVQCAGFLELSKIYPSFASYWMSAFVTSSDSAMDIFCEHVKNILMPLAEKSDPWRLKERFERSIHGRSLFTNEWEGQLRFGAGPGDIRTDDIAVVLFGGNVPYIVRPQPGDGPAAGSYELIGACYINGAMDGQMVDDWVNKGHPSQIFKFV